MYMCRFIKRSMIPLQDVLSNLLFYVLSIRKVNRCSKYRFFWCSNFELRTHRDVLSIGLKYVLKYRFWNFGKIDVLSKCPAIYIYIYIHTYIYIYIYRIKAGGSPERNYFILKWILNMLIFILVFTVFYGLVNLHDHWK